MIPGQTISVDQLKQMINVMPDGYHRAKAKRIMRHATTDVRDPGYNNTIEEVRHGVMIGVAHANYRGRQRPEPAAKPARKRVRTKPVDKSSGGA